VLEDVAGDEGFVDTRVFVCFQMLKRICGDTFVLCGLCTPNMMVSEQSSHTRGVSYRGKWYLYSAASWGLWRVAVKTWMWRGKIDDIINKSVAMWVRKACGRGIELQEASCYYAVPSAGRRLLAGACQNSKRTGPKLGVIASRFPIALAREASTRQTTYCASSHASTNVLIYRPWVCQLVVPLEVS